MREQRTTERKTWDEEISFFGGWGEGENGGDDECEKFSD
jgi:hypothetical protein